MKSFHCSQFHKFLVSVLRGDVLQVEVNKFNRVAFICIVLHGIFRQNLKGPAWLHDQVSKGIITHQ